MGKHPTKVEIVDVQKRRNPSKHYVYVINVTWSDGSVITVYRRYSAFFDFHVKILDDFPLDAGETVDGVEGRRVIPFLPGKKLFGRSHVEKVAKSRMNLLEEYLKALIECPPKIRDSKLTLEFFEANTLDIKPPSLEEREKRGAGLIDKVLGKGEEKALAAKQMQIGEVLILDQYRAVADYKKNNKTELTFSTGTTFEVIEKNDNGWWFVSMCDSDEQGWVPATYLEPLEEPDGEEAHSNPNPEKDEKYISTSAFKAKNPDEIGFEKGVVIIVLEKKLDGWWRVEYQGRDGWAPGSYLEKIQEYSPEQSRKAEVSVSLPPPKPPRPEPASSAATSQKTLEPPLRRSSISRPSSIHGEKGPFGFVAKKAGSPLQASEPVAISAPAPKPVVVPAKATPPTKPDPPKAVERPVQAAAPKPAERAPQVAPPKPAAPTKVETPAAPAKPAAPARPEVPVALAKPAAPAKPEAPSKQAVPVSGAGSVVAALKAKQGGDASPASAPIKASKPEPVVAPASAAAAADRYECFQAFKAESETEATMAEGEIVTVLEKADGWWYVQKSSGAEGWAPSTVLRPAPATKPTAAAKPALQPVKPAVRPSVAAKPAAAPAPEATEAAAVETFLCTADHNAESSEEISLKKGDVVTLLEKTDSWWFVKKGSAEGWAPPTFLEPTKGASGKPLTENVSCRRAYRGKKARQACEAALKGGRNRDFIVRDSETSVGHFSISVKIGSEIHHFKAEKKGTRLHVGEVNFADVEEAVEYFLKNPIYTSPSGEGVTLGSAFIGSI